MEINIGPIIAGLLFFGIMWVCHLYDKKVTAQAEAEYEAQCKHIQREYNGMKFNITICPWSESNKIWQCKYTSIDESIEDCFYFADYPSIEEQMEKHIAPQVTSMTRWQKRLQEIAEIS